MKAIDLFAGAGGFSLAAYNVGIDVQAAIELDQQAAESYYTNLVKNYHVKTQLFSQDINSVDIDALMKFQGIKQGELDILLGGPPCQGFSVHRINDAGKNDPRNDLLLRYFDFVKKLRPKAFLVENVPGLLWPRHAEYLDSFMSKIVENEYTLPGGRPVILNARDYGVPQNRKRAFILAVRNDLCAKDLVWPPPPTCHKNGPNTWVTASTVFERPPRKVLQTFKKRLSEKFNIPLNLAERCIEGLCWGEPLSKVDPCNISMKHSPAMSELFIKTPLLGDRKESGRELACHVIHDGHKDVYGRLYPHTPSNTMTTGCYNPSKGRFVHPWLPCGISLRHAARLQTFPDNFIFKGGSIAIARQIGNAVPVKLGEVLLQSLKEWLSNSDSTIKIQSQFKTPPKEECEL